MAKTKPKKSTIVERVLKLFDKHIDTTGAILDDYVADKEMVDELGLADKNFIQAVDALEVNDSDDLIRMLKDTNAGDIDVKDILDELDEDEIVEWLRSKSYTVVAESDCVVIKVDDLNLRNKLEDFVNREIYPHYNDQKAYTFF